MVHFVITGFGDFAGVHDNPSEAIAKTLPDYIQSRKKGLPDESEILICKPLKVSGQAVGQWLAKAAEEVQTHLESTAEVVWVSSHTLKL